jgi:signal transduction histidine kinase
LEKAEGNRHFDMKISPLYDHIGGYVGKIVVLRDITDRKAAEKELLKARGDLEQKVKERTFQLAMANESLRKENEDRMRAQMDREILIKELESKNCEMERFIYTVSHDLRSPLVTIHGFAGFLKKDLETGSQEKVKEDLKRIGDAAVRMDRLLCDTLELSRIGRVAEPPENIAFADIVSEALDQLSEKLRSSKVGVSVADGLPDVFVDKLRIVEVLTNIIENSIKYMGKQPSPKIDIGHKIEKEKAGKEAIFYVQDNGIGIDPGQQERVFDLFYKIDKKSEGTGAGLAIAKRIVEVHGGHIWVESQKGLGCTLWFTLPLAEGGADMHSYCLSSIQSTCPYECKKGGTV